MRRQASLMRAHRLPQQLPNSSLHCSAVETSGLVGQIHWTKTPYQWHLPALFIASYQLCRCTKGNTDCMVCRPRSSNFSLASHQWSTTTSELRPAALCAELFAEHRNVWLPIEPHGCDIHEQLMNELAGEAVSIVIPQRLDVNNCTRFGT